MPSIEEEMKFHEHTPLGIAGHILSVVALLCC